MLVEAFFLKEKYVIALKATQKGWKYNHVNPRKLCKPLYTLVNTYVPLQTPVNLGLTRVTKGYKGYHKGSQGYFFFIVINFIITSAT